MPTELTIPGIFHSQVCSDQPLEAVIAWMDGREVSSARWMLAPREAMDRFGAGDPSVVACAEKPGHSHYLLVVRGLFDE